MRIGRPTPRLTLRRRLILVATVTMTVVLAIFGVVLYEDLRHELLQSKAEELRRSAEPTINVWINGRRVARAPQTDTIMPTPAATDPSAGGASSPTPQSSFDPQRAMTDLAGRLTTRDTGARTFDPTGRQLGDGPQATGITDIPVPLLDAQVYRDVATTGEITYFRTTLAAQPYIVEVIPIVRGTGADAQTIGVLELSASMARADMVLRRFRVLVLAGTTVAVLITILASMPLIGNVLKPLRRMASTSRAIAAGDRSLRVDVPDDGDELTELAEAFNEMVGRLDDVLATQRRFIADASHELRSPLTALGGGVDMLLMGADRDDPASRKRLLNLMAGEIERMGRLIDDLLTLTRFDAQPEGMLHLDEVDLTELVSQLADEVRLVAPDRLVELDLPTGQAVLVQADVDRLHQALLNLCSNAHAHTPPGTPVAIRLRYGNGLASVTVIDRGPGIPPEDLQHIWDRFYRSDRARSRTDGGGGLGLGLSIAQAIAEAHGGSIDVESQVGRGTQFTFSLPGAVRAAQSAAVPAD
jgi:two-component system OmpR family sensor kinase